MTGWIILGVVLALILLFLFSNVRLFFRYDNGDIFLQARWLFVRYQILPEPERRRKKKKRENKEKEEKNVPSSKIGLVREEGTEKENHSSDEKKQSSQIAEDEKTGKGNVCPAKEISPVQQSEKRKKGDSYPADQESRTLRATVEQVLELLKAAKQPLKLLYCHLWVRQLDFQLIVSREDAAQTAIAYGRMNGWVHGAYAAISQFVRMKKGRILVQGDYLSQQDRLKVSFELTLRVLFLLMAAIQFFFRFLWKVLKNK